MTSCRPAPPVCALLLLVAGCSGGGADAGSEKTVTAADSRPYSGIGAGEAIHFTGTEPFWGGEVSGDTLTYQTPDDQKGRQIAVARFAGRNGVSFSGDLDGKPLVLAITPGRCSDGMSDRAYPFAATLQVRGEQRQGCAWTERQPFSGPRA